jgi:replication fork protection complex subunit Tof1/Swi1
LNFASIASLSSVSFAKQILTEQLFIAFLASLLKDIKSERPKITEKDHLRLLFVTKWFLEFFLLAITKSKEGQSGWSPTFSMVGEVVDRSWIVWILRRMRGALDEKVCRLSVLPSTMLNPALSQNNGLSSKPGSSV